MGGTAQKHLETDHKLYRDPRTALSASTMADLTTTLQNCQSPGELTHPRDFATLSLL